MPNPASIPAWKRGVFVAVYLLGCFLLLEILARLVVSPPKSLIQREHEQVIQILGLPSLDQAMTSDPDLFWALRPDLRLVVSGRINEHPVEFYVTTNDLGLRSAPVPPRRTGLRVLALDDSCTFGMGVDNDQTWPARLGEALSRPGGPKAEVINAGVPGYTAFQGLRYLTGRGVLLKPDVVVAEFGFNDGSSWASRSDIETARLLRIASWDEPLEWSRLYVGLRNLARQIHPPVIPREGFGHSRLSTDEFRDTLLEMNDVCVRNRIRMVLLLWPWKVQASPQTPILHPYQSIVRQVGETARIPTVDLIQAFSRDQRPLFIDHLHTNPAGCALAAETIARTIEGLPEGAAAQTPAR